MENNIINELRHSARKLVRELGILELSANRLNRAPQHWHSLIEIANQPNITIAQLRHLLLISPSTMSRVVNSLLKDGLVTAITGVDKREKSLLITPKGLLEIKNIDEFSNVKIKGALEYLTREDQHNLITALEKYTAALEKNRLFLEQVTVHTLSTSRIIRKQIISMIANIQINEFSIPVTDEINSGILKAENEYYYNKSYNFWYAVDNAGTIIGSIGLKRIDHDNAEIKKFFVHKDYRGKGISKRLFATLLKAALKHRFTCLYLGTVDVLHAAKRFYEKYGFSRISASGLPSGFIKCELDTLFFKIKTKELQATLAGKLEQ